MDMKRLYYLSLIVYALTAAAAAQSVSHSCPNGAPPTTGDCPSSGGGNNNRGGSRSSGPSAAQVRRRQLVELNNEAIAQINAGDCETAKATLHKAMQLDWYYGMAHYNYAICLYREGNYDGVISSIQMVIGYGGEGVDGKMLRKLVGDAQAAQREQAAVAERKRQQQAWEEQERQRKATEAEAERPQQEDAIATAKWKFKLERIGGVGAIRGSVYAVEDGKMYPLESGKPITRNEHIVTGPDSHVQIMLLDETVFTMGPNSDMILDEFVYDPDTSAGKITARITKGVFRWVTGKVARQGFNEKIKVPTGTIGIRGTDVEVSVGDQDVYTCNYWDIRGDGTKPTCKTITAETVVTLRSGEIDTVVPWYTGRQVKVPAGYADEILFTTCAYNGPEKLYDYHGDNYDGKPMLTLKATGAKRFIFMKNEGQVVCDDSVN